MRLPGNARFVAATSAASVVLLAAFLTAAAQGDPPATPAAPLHPTFALLDTSGVSVLESNGPVSAMQTCGQCHDTAYIAAHNDHAALTGRDPLADGLPAASGLAAPDEINCFLCHLESPDNLARLEAIRAGHLDWASAATLQTAGIVTRTADGWAWNAGAFGEGGELKPEFVSLGDPASENCGACHGVVQTDAAAEVNFVAPELDDPQTALTGQVFSGERIADSGLNLAGKDFLTRSWDVHAERGLECVDCHTSPNSPAALSAKSDGARPEHLVFDPRRLDFAEYLRRPDHRLSNTTVECAACHDAKSGHTWLPYADRHMSQLACETCHVPSLSAPALQTYDATVLSADGSPSMTYRGFEAGTDLITGYQPALLPREYPDGRTRLAPYNLVGVWQWVVDDGQGNAEPVSRADLQSAWFDGSGYASEVLSAFDADGDGALGAAELALDTPEKQALIADRLSALGLANPRIAGEVQPYAVHHDVARGEWALRDCAECHGDDSRVSAAMAMASSLPGGVAPSFSADAGVDAGGSLIDDGGTLFYAPATGEAGLYVFGHDRVDWVDWLGGLAFLGTLLGVTAHGGLRVVAAVRAPRGGPRLKRVYMYAVYERFWHWLQTFTIVLLLFTGLIIHRPDVFGVFSLPHVVATHNVLAALLVINAALALFYHLASGEIRQFLPRPYGFFDQAIVQARYCLRGIFRREPHPFEKTPQKKLNPLQQVTYFGILNVLLPLQVITGALMWGAQTWPRLAGMLGGLPVLAPFHSLVAWLFAAFVVGHVYLTTTGHEPLAGIRSMMLGWDEVEDHTTPDESSVVEAQIA